MNSYQSRIKSKLDEISKQRHIRLHIENAQKQVQEKSIIIQNLKPKLDEKFDDWERMEQINIRSVFHKILGNQEQQIEKERQEYLKSSMDYSEAVKAKELLEFELQVLQKKLLDDKKLEQELSQLKSAREAEILKSDIPEKKRLLELNATLEKWQVWIADAQEVKIACAAADKTLTEMVELLRTAKNWGSWDKMSNQARASKSLKYNHVDRAIRLAPSARKQLDLLTAELADIGRHGMKLSFRIEQFSRFGHDFFDSLITDWVIQQKIQHSLYSVQQVLQSVVNIDQEVSAELNETQLKMNTTQDIKDKLLIS